MSERSKTISTIRSEAAASLSGRVISSDTVGVHLDGRLRKVVDKGGLIIIDHTGFVTTISGTNQK